MYVSRRAFLAGLGLSAGFILGCSDKPQGMPNMKAGTGPVVEKEVRTKKVKRALPPEPPGPQAPP
jgi:hypothetical protein